MSEEKKPKKVRSKVRRRVTTQGMSQSEFTQSAMMDSTDKSGKGTKSNVQDKSQDKSQDDSQEKVSD